VSAPLRVLCLDIEGGHGGSSRSLVELLRHVDRAAVAPEVWCRRDGPTRARLEALGLPVRIAPDMPKVSSLPRLSRNLAVYGRFALDWARAGGFRRACRALPHGHHVERQVERLRNLIADWHAPSWECEHDCLVGILVVLQRRSELLTGL